MSIDLSQIQSIADGILLIRALRNRHAEGYDVVSDATDVLTVINSLECCTAEDALALIEISQVLAADLFITAGGDLDDPHQGTPETSNLAAMIINLGKAMAAIQALMFTHPFPSDGLAN